jgi:hypothetical protein
MDNSYLNFIVFFLSTILYFSIKPDPDIKTADGKDPESAGGGYMMIGAYFLVVIISQFFINSYLITTSCGGDVMSNLKESALYTFMPWTLIFGVTIITIVAYPDIKGAFSDVYGYYFVSAQAQTILTTLLKGKIDTSDPNTNIVETVGQGITNTAIDSVAPGSTTVLNAITGTEPNNQNNDIINTDINKSPVPVLAGGGKKYMQKGGALSNDEVSDLVLKIYGNMSILINQLTPNNFTNYWDNMLKPLFKDKYKNEPMDETTKVELNKMEDDLLKLVIKRDNIGEGMWYIYTGILICSLVQFKLSGVGCKSNQEVLATNYRRMREEQKTAANAATTTATK